jgi:hypothetical protein
MFMKYIFCAFLLLTQSCIYDKISDNTNHSNIQNHAPKKLNHQHVNEIYKNIVNHIKKINASHLKECNCMKAFHRNLWEKADHSARYVFDEKVGEHALQLGANHNSISILAIGSGKLLNELTAFANILARGKNLNIYLIDFAYIFYQDPQLKETALSFVDNPKIIPPGWRYFDFWEKAESNRDNYISLFDELNHSINEFKLMIKHLDAVYKTTSTINIIEPGKNDPVRLPLLDMIIAVDTYMDIPNLIRNLHYKIKLDTHKSVRFIALNKYISSLGYWDNDDLSLREEESKRPVSLEIYDVKMNKISGCYNRIQRIVFNPSASQLKNAIEFISNPDKDTTQSPLEMIGKKMCYH